MSEGPFLPGGAARGLWRTRGARTLVLWVVLVVMFLAIWQVLQPSSNAPAQDVPVPDTTDFWRQTLVTLLPMVFVAAAFVLFLVSTIRRARSFNAANGHATRALAEGDYAAAGEQFERLASRFRWPANLRLVARFNLAIARLHQGRLDDALTLFAEVERRASWSLAGLRASLAAHVALAYALRDELEPARTWRKEAEGQLKHASDQATMTGLLAFVDAVVDVREGRHETFLRWLDERWRQLEGSLTARTTRPLRVLRAFAIAQGSVRDVAAAEKIVEGLRPVRPGEFAMLEASWPEMKAFLASMQV